MIHSVPAEPVPAPCGTAVRRPGPRLRRHVLAYGAFTTTAAVAHRFLPINVLVLVVDLTGECRVATGPRAAPAVGGPDRWRHGVTVGLTPAAMSALLGGLPVRELTGRAVPLTDLLGHADQPHLTRDVRALAGLTPAALRAFLQDRPIGAA